jgi:hypothetical protein
MKWLLFLIAIGLGYYSYTQSQTIDTLTANLKQSDDALTELRKQVPAAQARPAAPAASGTASYATPAPRPSWMNTASDLDKTPVPGRHR